MNFDQLLGVIERNKTIKENGGITSIQGPFPRLGQIYGGFTKSSITAITASSGVGKTKFVKQLAVTNVINQTANTDIKVKIFYFALEENATDFWLSFICTWLYKKYKINISTQQLKSIGQYTVSKELLEKIIEARKAIEYLQDRVEVIDYIRNPTGILKYVKAYFDNPNIGEYITKRLDDGREVITGYKYKDENLWVFCVVDHISLLSNELSGETRTRLTSYQTFDMFIKDYVLEVFSKRFQMANIIVHQQTPSSEKAVYTSRGSLIEERIEPSLEELHINKGIHQDYEIVMGLFNPSRYDIEVHNGYDISLLGRGYRALKFLKDRHYGLENSSVGLFFNGATGNFTELPRAEVMQAGNYYEKFINELTQMQNSQKETTS
jgi:nucleoside-triphosphatase THEP1